MKVKTYCINTTSGKMYGLCRASDGQILYSGARWKTERGAICYAKKNGWEIIG